MELIKGNVKVEWVRLGEGYDGDYDPSDPEDVELLRFDVSVQNPETLEWEEPRDSSYCTLFPTDSPEEQQQKALELIMFNIYDHASAGLSIKRRCEELSWIDPYWVNDYLFIAFSGDTAVGVHEGVWSLERISVKHGVPLDGLRVERWPRDEAKHEYPELFEEAS